MDSISGSVVPLAMFTNKINQHYLRRGLDGWKGKYQFPFNCLHRQPSLPLATPPHYVVMAAQVGLTLVIKLMSLQAV